VCRGCSALRAVSLCVVAALLSEQSHCVSWLLCSPSSLTVCRGSSALRATSSRVVAALLSEQLHRVSWQLCSPSSLTVCRGSSALRAISLCVVAALLSEQSHCVSWQLCSLAGCPPTEPCWLPAMVLLAPCCRLDGVGSSPAGRSVGLWLSCHGCSD
jgi:hypothetical protein